VNLQDFSTAFGEPPAPAYLEAHLPRLCRTRELAYRSWQWQPARILDVGAHWLYLSLLFARDGHQVTAADFGATLEDPAVRKTALDNDIELLVYDDLSSEAVFGDVPDDSIDVVLFCEILEHITFNPVGMWRALHRVLKPGGRIILTTPNYYSLAARLSRLKRALSGTGGGIPVSDILGTPTNAPHWKEYSKKELRQYFGLLSEDFRVRSIAYFSFVSGSTGWKTRVHRLVSLVPSLRKGIYAEVDLVRKHRGITVIPTWN